MAEHSISAPEPNRFALAKWSQRDKQVKCPHCGAGRGTYKEYLYVGTGRPVDPEGHTCGRCDHETSCGYHLTPGEFFRLHPEADLYVQPLTLAPVRQLKRIEIDSSLVGRFHRHAMQHLEDCPLLEYMQHLPMSEDNRQSIPYLMQMYAIGTTTNHSVIWWQIDEQRVVRTGKVMQYNVDGHRSKNPDGSAIGMNWIHALLRRKYNAYPDKEYDLVQCLFGQHLLTICPEAEVHLVESEKTAFLMSVLDDKAMSEHIWLATGGKYLLNESTFLALKGRRVICYPDADGISDWAQKVGKRDGWTIYTGWTRLMGPFDSPKSDILDLTVRMLRERQQPLPSAPSAFETWAQRIEREEKETAQRRQEMKEDSSVKILIDNFNLKQI